MKICNCKEPKVVPMVANDKPFKVCAASKGGCGLEVFDSKEFLEAQKKVQAAYDNVIENIRQMNEESSIFNNAWLKDEDDDYLAGLSSASRLRYEDDCQVDSWVNNIANATVDLMYSSAQDNKVRTVGYTDNDESIHGFEKDALHIKQMVGRSMCFRNRETGELENFESSPIWKYLSDDWVIGCLYSKVEHIEIRLMSSLLTSIYVFYGTHVQDLLDSCEIAVEKWEQEGYDIEVRPVLDTTSIWDEV